MTRHYLFGPVTAAFADQNLRAARQSGHGLAFNDSGDLNLTIRPTDNWADFCAQLPAGWQTDFVGLCPIRRFSAASGRSRLGRAVELTIRRIRDAASVAIYRLHALTHSPLSDVERRPVG